MFAAKFASMFVTDELYTLNGLLPHTIWYIFWIGMITEVHGQSLS